MQYILTYLECVISFSAVRGLDCLCNDHMILSCFFDHSMTCGGGELCAVVYDRYREASASLPNPRVMCLDQAACNGTNSTTFVACCDQDLCNDETLVEPVYPTTLPVPTTTNPPLNTSITKTMNETDLTSMDSSASTCVCVCVCVCVRARRCVCA